jgi:hypothetical protein
MSYRVRIFLRRLNQKDGRYVGERRLPEIPRLHGLVFFDDGSGVQKGKVERIYPDAWEPASELIPSIHVVEDAEA